MEVVEVHEVLEIQWKWLGVGGRRYKYSRWKKVEVDGSRWNYIKVIGSLVEAGRSFHRAWP